MSRANISILIGVLAALPVQAQRPQFSLEANPFHGTVGIGWTTASGNVVGVDAGFGFAQLDHTLVPSDEDLEDFLHLGVFMRSPASNPFLFDARIQIGLAELRGCSGCLPGFMAATSGGVFWGSRRVKVGTRVLAGAQKDSKNSPAVFVLQLTPIALLLTF
jgi:hypothetical protein